MAIHDIRSGADGRRRKEAAQPEVPARQAGRLPQGLAAGRLCARFIQGVRTNAFPACVQGTAALPPAHEQ